MKPHAFLIPIVLGVACIAVVALLNWTPTIDPATSSAPTPVTISRKGRVHIRHSADDTAGSGYDNLGKGSFIETERPSGNEVGRVCIYVRESGIGNRWTELSNVGPDGQYVYGRLVVSKVPSGVVRNGLHVLSNEHKTDYENSVRFFDIYEVLARSVDMFIYALAHGAGGCQPPPR